MMVLGLCNGVAWMAPVALGLAYLSGRQALMWGLGKARLHDGECGWCEPIYRSHQSHHAPLITQTACVHNCKQQSEAVARSSSFTNLTTLLLECLLANMNVLSQHSL